MQQVGAGAALDLGGGRICLTPPALLPNPTDPSPPPAARGDPVWGPPTSPWSAVLAATQVQGQAVVPLWLDPGKRCNSLLLPIVESGLRGWRILHLF